MIIIGICDAEPSVRIHITEFIERFRNESDQNIKVLSYNTGEKLLHRYSLEMDLIFLEIPFKKLSGIEIAKRIREADSKVRIVFLTGILNRVLEAYSVGADNYLLKPLSYESFYSEVTAAINNKIKHDRKYFIEKNRDGIYKIFFDGIKYIETCGRRTVIHTETARIISRKQMKTFEKILLGGFVRCHTGYIVSLKFFSKLEGHDFILMTGEKIPVSRKRYACVVEALDKFYKTDGESDAE